MDVASQSCQELPGNGVRKSRDQGYQVILLFFAKEQDGFFDNPERDESTVGIQEF